MAEALNGTAAKLNENVAEQYAAELLELFYPIHYRGNMAVEDAMRGELTRKQAAILWLIRSAGSDGGRCMRRKDIVSRLQDWFEVSSPAVTQALRRMARPPLELVRLIEDADSGREKRVLLTSKGQRSLVMMVERGRGFLQKVVEQLPEEQVRAGVEFLRAGVNAFERVHAETSKADSPKRTPKADLRRHHDDHDEADRDASETSDGGR
jgi:DNA-binding MarR family transcriptional regulator